MKNLNNKARYCLLLIVLLINFLFITGFCYGAIAPLEGVAEEQYGQEQAFMEEAGYGADIEIGEVVATIIKAFLGLLGIIFIVLLLVAGFKWMVSGGNEEKVNEAKDMIRRAIIGLIITVSAYAITYFIFNAMDWVGGGGGIYDM